MEHWAPLIQTLLWVGLIGGVTFRYRGQIQNLLEAITDRIKLGGGIKAGPLELSAIASPQSADAQRERAKAELRELTSSEPASAANPNAQPPLKQLEKELFRVEDLALRAVQEAYGIPIGRQVEVAGRAQFDGAFVKHGFLFVVEVKYLRHGATTEQIQDVVNRTTQSLLGIGMTGVTLILAAVLDTRRDIEQFEVTLKDLPIQRKISVDIRLYSREELVSKFTSSGDA
jgi:hypothetical protein